MKGRSFVLSIIELVKLREYCSMKEEDRIVLSINHWSDHFTPFPLNWWILFNDILHNKRRSSICSSVDLWGHKSTKTCHFSDIDGEPLQRLPPIQGFENAPLVSLDEATKPLIGLVQEIEHMIYTIQGKNIHEKDGLTIDESSSIALYSLEWKPPEKSFYFILNETLRAPNRQTLLRPWFRFLKLFFTGLSKLPSTGHQIIFRGVKLDLRDQYKEGERIVWWGFSSCTKTVAILENEEFVGTSRRRTLFTIESDTGKDIGEHSFFEKEDEILLLPGREFEVLTSLNMDNKLTMIHLKEVQPAFPNLSPLPSSNPPLSTSIISIPSATIAVAEATASPVQPKPIIQPVEVFYFNKNLTSNDIPGIIKEVFQQQQCTILNLSGNRITHEGAALLSKALKHNEVSDSLNISTIGEGKPNWQRKRTIEFDCSISEHINLKIERRFLFPSSSFFPSQWKRALSQYSPIFIE